MKANLIKTTLLLASLAAMSACSGNKGNSGSGNDSDNKLLNAGPQDGRILAYGSDSTYCDINNGSIICSSRDLSTNAPCSTAAKTYDKRNVQSFCQQITAIHSETSQAGSCNVSAVTNRIIQDYCSGYNVAPKPPNTNPYPYPYPNPNFPYPNNPGMPGGPGMVRSIMCTASMNGGLPTLLPLLAGPATTSFQRLWFREGPGGLVGLVKDLFGKKDSRGELNISYQPQKGKIPETLTAWVKFADRSDKNNKRDLFAKHSGSASAPFHMDADMNGTNIVIDCNQDVIAKGAINEAATLVCAGTSHMTGGTRENDLQFVRPISSINSGEDVDVSEAVRIQLDKSNSMLTVVTSVDSLLGPNVTSASSLKADVLIEAREQIGNVKLKCSLR